LPVSDKLKIEQGHIVRERRYPLRDRQLEANKRAQSEATVKPTDGVRAFANFPDHELERLAEKGRTDRYTPSYYADLTSPDAKDRSKAIKRLVSSPEGKIYRVGSTSKKSFHFRNNPLAKD
jgi:hypothetical protein